MDPFEYTTPKYETTRVARYRGGTTPNIPSVETKVIVTRSGAFVNISDWPEEHRDLLIKTLTKLFTIMVKSVLGHMDAHKMLTYQRDKQRLILPRGITGLILSGEIRAKATKFSKISVHTAASLGLSNAIIENQLPPGEAVTLIYTGKPIGNQQVVLRALFGVNESGELDPSVESGAPFSDTIVANGGGHVIVNLVPGQGKTYVAAAAMDVIQRRTLVIVPNTPLLDQWYTVLCSVFPQNVIGRYSGKHKTHGDIVVAVVNSMCGDEMVVEFEADVDAVDVEDEDEVDVEAKTTKTTKVKKVKKTTKVKKAKKITQTYKPFDYFAMFGLIVYDEAHEYTGKERRKLLSKAAGLYTLGLSGTPYDNIQGLDPITWWTIGPVLDADKLPGYAHDATNFSGVVHQIQYFGPDCYTEHVVNESIGTTSVPGLVSQLCEDVTRIDVIVQCTRMLREKNLNVFVFADRKSFLVVLQNAFVACGVTSVMIEDVLDVGVDAVDVDDEVDIDAEIDIDDMDDASIHAGKPSNAIKPSKPSKPSKLDTHAIIIKHESLATRVRIANNATNTSQILTGGATKGAASGIAFAEQNARIILTTYQYLGTGRSIPKMNGVIFCTPRRSKSMQFVNRIFRLGASEEITRHIVDIVDMRMAIRSQWDTRARYYRSMNYPITVYQVKVPEKLEKKKVYPITVTECIVEKTKATRGKTTRGKTTRGKTTRSKAAPSDDA